MFACGSALVGSLPPIITKLLPPADIAMLLILRFVVQGVLLFLLLVIFGFRKSLPSAYTLVAGISFAIYSLAFFESIELTAVSHAIILSSLYPLELLAAAMIAGGHKIRLADLIALGFMTTGLLMLWDGAALRFGDLLAAVSSVAFAAYLLATNRVVYRGPRAEAITHQAYVSAACAGVIILLTPALLHGSTALRSDLTGSWEPAVWTALAGAMSNSLLTMSQISLPPLIASIVAVSSPVIAALIGAFLFNPGHVLPAAVGCCLCGVGLVIVSYQHRRLSGHAETIA